MTDEPIDPNIDEPPVVNEAIKKRKYVSMTFLSVRGQPEYDARIVVVDDIGRRNMLMILGAQPSTHVQAAVDGSGNIELSLQHKEFGTLNAILILHKDRHLEQHQLATWMRGLSIDAIEKKIAEQQRKQTNA